ncbi:hypothetical protein [Sphingomonas oryzagri]|uniref:Uncharacterized protein n=1 Tax=Sphingomonas oryzagri TaxID=3042314 RepID=A0ABT6N384_9SPHN|nr:hypothetical protein [Sphingomonas oryzagri]MDH7639214.1 hypothetical protein [Sphingomonas oryzagri]
MDATASPTGIFDSFLALARAWTPIGMAPQWLDQPILPGWSLISVNETNSASPDTERAVVAKASYGRQLGRIMDAMGALIDERPASAGDKPTFDALKELAVEIEHAKRDAAKARIERLRSDLEMLSRGDPAEFERQKAMFGTLFT